MVSRKKMKTIRVQMTSGFKRGMILMILMNLMISSLMAQTFYQQGLASFYADKFNGRTTANGEKYRPNELTAAHLTLPFGTRLKVVNVSNNRSVEVRVNDRGPFVKGRIIDLSKKAANKLDFIEAGVVEVKLYILEGINTGPSSENTLKWEHTGAREYYRMEAEKLEPAGYGIQIGSYKEMSNLMRLTDKLQASYGDDVIIEVGEVNGVRVYRVIIGRFDKKEDAVQLEKKLKKTYRDCFVITY